MDNQNIVSNHAIEVFWSNLIEIKQLLAQDDVQEVMINSPKSIWVERSGKMSKLDLELNPNKVLAAALALRSSNGKESSPVMDARSHGIRIALALSPVAINGHSMCIRKHSRLRFKLEDYEKNGSFDILSSEELKEKQEVYPRPNAEYVANGGQGVTDMLRWMMKTHKNILIAGATSSGKTSFLDAMLGEIDPERRVITIEDTAEMKVEVPNSVSFEVSEKDNIKVWNLVKLALRYRPDSIIVGEIRGAEAYDLLDALNTGHDGGLCTLHANSALLGLMRLEGMVRKSPDAANLPLRALRDGIASVFNFVVYASRKGGKRGPEEIIEVLGVDEKGDYIVKNVFNKIKK